MTKPKAENGIVEYQPMDWMQFVEVIHAEFLVDYQYIWRGQRRDDWRLESTIDRALARSRRGNKEQARRNHLVAFQYAARGRRGIHPKSLTDDEWWSLGQHYGLATPLLDWCLSPFVAAFFAFEKSKKPETQHRAVFALARWSLSPKNAAIEFERARDERTMYGPSPTSGPNLFAIMESVFGSTGRPDAPKLDVLYPFTDDNPRLVNQGGVFTRTPNGTSVEEWVKRNFTNSEETVLVKFRISTTSRDEVLTALNRMNVNHLSLFPDLHGSTQFCNMALENEFYGTGARDET